MGYDVGAVGVWGVILGPENVGQALLDEMKAKLTIWRDRHDNDDYDWENDPLDLSGEDECEALETFVPQVREALFNVAELTCPEGCGFAFVEDSAPGRVETDPGSLVFGIGMHLAPWKWPAVDESFKEKADLHTWVWGG